MDIISRKQAKALGLKWYFTGKPCKHGHVTKRYATGACHECMRITTLKNRGKYTYKVGRKQYMQQWRADNKDKVRENFNTWCEKNPERRKKHEVRSNAKRYAIPELRQAAIDNAAAWKRANPGLVNNFTARRRARKAQRTPAYADQDAIKFFYECCPKGCHVDHVIPLHGKIISGFHVESNLQWLTAKDNLLKLNTWTSE